MRQPTPTIPVTSKMLRHFAVVTVAITACIGIFAQGENTVVAAKTTPAAAPESGGGFLDFGGAERAALAGNKGSHEVNGIKLAAGTKLNTGGDDGTDGGGGGGGGASGEGWGYIQSEPSAMPAAYGPAGGQSPAIEGSGLAPPVAAPPIPKDPNGAPAPGASVNTINPGKPGKPQPPRKASQQDIDRMMAASSQRSGRATTD
ncbi:MAG: hypothetical protein ABIM50_07795 [Novosphingobium sp.]